MPKAVLAVTAVEPRLARETGLKPGDRILRVDARPVQDELDFRFWTGGERTKLDVLPSHVGGVRRIQVTREQAGGLSFAPMQIRQCSNRCLFCFVDQLPPGLRKSLYVRDEDVRYSFLYGNYVTLSSVTDEELDRVRRMRMSPLYVSVHATDSEVRNLLLGRKRSRDILETLGALTRWGITLHTQVVLCPGINDGEVLEKTVRDLAGFRPFLASIAVVPVGLTRFRRSNGLPPLRGVGRRDSLRIIRQVEQWKAQWAGGHPDPFLMLGDEFYRKSGIPFPPIRAYGDLPQLENGVGMIPLFLRRWEESRKKRRSEVPCTASPHPFVVVTGELAAPFVVPYVHWMEESTGVRLAPVVVKNDFLGPRVNVAGLITGKDLRRQLEGRVRRVAGILVPDVMLNPENGLLLDDVSLPDLERELGVPVSSFTPDPEGFEKALRKAAVGRPKKRNTDPMVD